MSELENREPIATSVGQALVILGLLLVYGVGGYWYAMEVVRDEESPLWLKLGIPAIVVGFTVLLLSVILQRMKAAKTDKYTNIHD
jgi:TRAP-type C4-dicarboxylate transport system permease small subunit